jgi:macrodomain Ter protein organizer (MatP/YcbG family)
MASSAFVFKINFIKVVPMFKSLLISLLSWLSLCLLTNCCTAASVADLVSKLNSSSFSERQTATDELLQLNESDLPTLEGILSNKLSAESKLRLTQVTKILRKKFFDRHLNDFAKGIDNESTLKLPCWERFQKIVGHDKQARDLFVEILREEADLMFAYETSNLLAQQKLLERLNDFFTMINQARSGNRQASLGMIAAAWFVCADPTIELDVQSLSLTTSLYYQGGAVHREKLMPLFRAILKRDLPDEMLPTIFNLAQSQNLDETQGLALRILQSARVHGHTRMESMRYLYIKDRKQLLPLLEPLLEDTTICMQFFANGIRANNGPRTPNKVLVKDIALVYLLACTGQKPADLKLELPTPDSNSGTVDYQKIIFADDEARDKAHATWNAWWKAHRAEHLPATKK